MLKLDSYAEGLLFQCDGCRSVGERLSHGVEEEGRYYCWNCLKELNRPKAPFIGEKAAI